MTTTPLGRIGVWRWHTSITPQLAAGLEELGYGTLWVGGSPPADLGLIDQLLDATETLTLATGIVNIFSDEAWPVAGSYHRITDRHPHRFLLGIGAGHPEALGERFTKPYEAIQRYLDELEAAAVPPEDVILAALGPRMLRLAADRTVGAHPYLTTPEHTERARAILGDGAILAPEHKVVLDVDPARARDLGRTRVANPYLRLRNYTNNLRRLGFTDADIADEGSDALLDALVAHGDADTAAARLTAHLDAGADHVAIQLLTPDPDADPLPGYRELAGALALSA